MINLLIQIKFRKGYYFFTCFKEFLEKNPVVRQIPAVRYMNLWYFLIPLCGTFRLVPQSGIRV